MEIEFDGDFLRTETGIEAGPGTAAFDAIWASIPWERRSDAPRFEAWFDDAGTSYSYGRGAGFRTYASNAKPDIVVAVKAAVEKRFGCVFEGCFANGYGAGRDWLGWHADDSPEMDDARPIAIVTLGGSRNIEFRPKGGGAKIDAMTRTTTSGSLLVMPAGFQDVFEHRIPKAGYVVAPRISLTFRGIVR